MSRVHQVILIGSVLLGSWLGMQAVHELGHVLAAWLTGGEIVKIVLHPLTLSRTELADNPHPLVVVWGGPIVGVLLPLALWGVGTLLRLPAAFVLRFFAGFCLVANGAYIAGGSFNGIGDCGQMLRHGSPIWSLWLFGAITIPVGFWLWHRQGGYFGLGPARVKVDPSVAYVSLVVCLLLIALDLLIGGE